MNLWLHGNKKDIFLQKLTLYPASLYNQKYSAKYFYRDGNAMKFINTLEYLLELTAMFSVFFFLLGFPLSKNRCRLFSAFCLSVVWHIIWYRLPFSCPNTITAIIVMALLFHDKIQYKIYWGTLFIFTEAIICKSISIILLMLLGITKEFPNFPTAYIDCITFIIMALISFLLKSYQEKCINFIHNINFIGYAAIMSVTIVDFILILSAPYIYYDKANKTGRLVIVIASLLLIIMTVVMLFLYFSLRHSYQKLRQMDAISQRSLELEKEQYLSLQQKNNDLRKFRHDFHNHILSLQELARKEEYTELAAYLSALSSEQIQTNIITVGNTIVDAIINHTVSKLDSSVQFHYGGQFSKNCFVTDMDLCILFSNLLDNAREGIELCNIQNKEINLEIFSDERKFMLMIENSSRPYLPDELCHLKTQKTDKRNHGFGLINIRDVVNKYQGAMDIKYSDGFFSVHISIQNLGI